MISFSSYFGQRERLTAIGSDYNILHCIINIIALL